MERMLSKVEKGFSSRKCTAYVMGMCSRFVVQNIVRHSRISEGSVTDIGLFLALFLGTDPDEMRICRMIFRTMNRQCICLTYIVHILDRKHALNFESQTREHN